jgi:predicted GNAT superfamily acetyltransferase
MTSAREVSSMASVTVQEAPHPRAGKGTEDTEPAAQEPALAADDAARVADEAAHAAGVVLREVTGRDGFDAVCRLFAEIWRPDPHNPPVTAELLRALTKAGNYVVGAYDGTRLLGACVGFFGPPADTTMHSHIAGVSTAVHGRSVGFAMKAHQRAWALRRGVATIGWTFDPLVRRNAYFNVVKLAASPAEYLTNFYGGMHDGINGSDDTDRLLVRWDLCAPAVVRACTGVAHPGDAAAELARGAAVVLGRAEDGGPTAGSPDTAGGTALVAVPTDIEAMRATDPDLAKRWRVALREALGGQMAAGARVTGFDRAGWYIVERSGLDSAERDNP